jgi:2-keto-3-deoxy-L-fuconate dehydrogenase
MAGEFDGLAAIVTGGGSGIGLAAATHLSERGAKVSVLDLNVDGVPEPLLGFKADVSDDASVRSAVAAAAEAMGGIDIARPTPVCPSARCTALPRGPFRR